MAFFQPFQAVLNPKSPVFVTTKAGEPLIAQRLTRPNKPRCLSAGPLRPPSAYPIRGSAARAPVRLRHGDVTRGAHHGFAIEGEAIAHDVFVGVGIVFGSIILVVIVAVLSRRGILVGVILTVLVGIVGIFMQCCHRCQHRPHRRFCRHRLSRPHRHSPQHPCDFRRHGRFDRRLEPVQHHLQVRQRSQPSAA